MTNSEATELSIREIRIADDDAAVIFSVPGGDVLPFPLEPAAARSLDLALKGNPGEPANVQGLLENAIRHLEGKVVRAEIGFNPRPGPLVHLVIDQDGKTTKMPSRLADAVALAHRHGAPVCADADAMKWMCIHEGETGASAAAMEWNDVYRLTQGFTALGRTDDAIPAVRRLRELRPELGAWSALLGRLYRKKGWLTSAAREMAGSLAWSAMGGYIGGAIDVARELATIDLASLPLRTLRAPALIEDFQSPQFNNEWWSGGGAHGYPGDPARRAYWFGEDQDWFIITLGGTQKWESARAVAVDLYLASPPEVRGMFTLALDLAGDRPAGYKAPDREVHGGWNRLVYDLREPVWRHEEEPPVKLDAPVVGPVKSIWFLFGSGRPAGDILVADVRLE